MQTTHQSASQPFESAPEHPQFRIREQVLCETDRAAWVREHLEWPIVGAVYREAQSATRQNPASRLFFAHSFAFFREAELLELPIGDSFLSEWLALAFEGAYDLATNNREQAGAWLEEFPADRQLAERRFRTIKRQSQHPDQGAHDFVIRAVESGSFRKQPVRNNKVTVSSLISGVEACFWTGLFAATEARHDPEAVDLVEWFDSVGDVRWNDARYHTQLIRKAPGSGRNWSSEFLAHPLLRIAEEKYGRSPREGAAIGGLLEHLCMAHGIQSERQIIWRDLTLAQWVRDAAGWGALFLREHSDTVRQIVAETNALTGDQLSRFYRRVLDGVDDINDFVEVTLAFLSWQSGERGEAATRYHGERLETVVNCVDAAVWLPWWLAREASRQH